MADIEMPQLGETVTEGTITKWFKAIGDSVDQDEVLFEVSTDKVDTEVPSPAGGTLSEILVPEGETVDVGTVLAIVGDGAAPVAPAAETAPPAEPVVVAEAPEEPVVEQAPAAEPIAETPAPEPSPTPAPAAQPAQSVETPVSPESVQPATPTEAGEGGDPASLGSQAVLSPVVRRLIKEYSIDVSEVEGTGLGGRISRDDVQRYIESNQLGSTSSEPAPASSAPSPAAGSPATETDPAAAPAPSPQPVENTSSAPAPAPATNSSPVVAEEMSKGTRDLVVPLSNIRLRTGEHMVASKAIAPHTLTAIEVDYEAVESIRKKHGAAFKEQEGFSLTYLPFITRATIDALREYPHLNSSVGDGELVVHNYVNIAVAVDLDFQGLLAPVVRDADGKRMRTIARDVHDLANRARSKKLAPDELVGGTFTLTNAGSYGTMMQFPIINQPQVAILSTDAIKRKPVVVEDQFGNESLSIHSVGVLAMAWDHRAIDGAYAAAFLARVKEIIEKRDWLPELA